MKATSLMNFFHRPARPPDPFFSLPKTAPAILAMMIMAGGVGTAEVIDNDTKEVIGVTEVIPSSPLYIGNFGEATLRIAERGSLTLMGGTGSDLYLAYYPTSDGTASVTGADSVLDIGNIFYLGTYGRGHLNVEDGGAVHTGASAWVGFYAGSFGEALVTGSGSVWSVTSSMVLGAAGHGELTVSDGGLVTAGNIRLGSTDGAAVVNGSGTVVVSGSTSRLETTGTFDVGYTGEGELVIRNGGTVVATALRVAQGIDTQGDVLITGSGSVVQTTNPTYIGNNGSATLTIENGGKLVTGNAVGANNEGSRAEILVTGTGSRWENLAYFEVGNGGWGRMEIRDGAVVTSGTVNMASDEGSYGEILITGEDSAWNGALKFQIGYSGVAKLTVNDGGKVSTSGRTSWIRVGIDEGSYGTINLGGEAGDDARQAGILDTPEVSGGNGTGILQFNHTATAEDPYYVTRDGTATGETLKLTGRLGVIHTAGATVFGSANTYTGGTAITGGAVITSNMTALGNGGLTLGPDGILNPLAALRINGAFAWNGGVIAQSLGTTATTLQVNGLLSNTMDGGEFSLSAGAGFSANTAYTLLSWTAGKADGFDASLLGVNSLDGYPLLTPTFIEAGNTLQIIYLGAASGAILQNSGPYFTPTDADFLVQENVETGTAAESNLVNSLTFSDDGTLTIHNELTLASGTVDVEAGSNSALLGGAINNEAGDFTFNIEGDLLISSQLQGGEWESLLKFGEGTLTLLGENSYGGNTAINEGVLAIAADGNLGLGGDLEFGGGTLRALGSFATDRNIWLWNEGGAIDIDAAQTVVWNGLISNVVPDTGIFSKRGLGTLEVTQANPLTGEVIIEEGTLRTRHEEALGTGTVTLNDGGILNAVGKLALTHLIWNGGGVLALGSEEQAGGWFEIGDLEKGSDGDFAFSLEYSGIVPNTDYVLLSFEQLLGFNLEDFSANELYGIVPILTLTDDNRLVIRYEGSVITGPILQNSGPYWTPTDAIFTVAGPASTGSPTEDNTIRRLVFEDGGSLEVHNTLVVTDGSFTVGEGRALLSGERIEAPGAFTKEGDGVLIVDADFLGAAGGASIEEGGLVLNSSFEAPGGLNIGAGGWLGGSGVITASVINSGLLSPGNSPGTLTIIGDYVQTGSGSFLLEIGSASNFDQLVVHGTASLAGTLEVVPYPYGGSFGETYTFLHADSIEGGFDNIQLPSGFRGRFLTSGGSGSLLLAPESYTQLAQTPNQKRTARALDRFIDASSGDRATVSLALDRLSAEEYPDAFDQISPGFYQTLPSLTLEQSNAQGQLFQQRFGAVGIGARGFSQSGMDAPVVAGSSGREYKDGKAYKGVRTAKEVADVMIPLPENRWAIWVQGNGLFARQNSVNNIPTYRFDSGGFLLGADYAWSDQFATGLYAGYQGVRARYDDGSRAAVDAARFGGYALYQADCGFYANGLVGGGYSSYTVRRRLDFGSIDRTARSKPDGGEFSAMLGGGYDWRAGGLTLGPIASAQYTYVAIGSFAEEGARSLDLRLDHQEVHSFRSTLGARVAYAWELGGEMALIPEARVTWQHEFLQESRTLDAALDGGSGPSFTYATAAPSRDALFAGAGVNLQVNSRWSANLYYNVDCGRGDFRSQMVSGGVNIRF